MKKSLFIRYLEREYALAQARIFARVTSHSLFSPRPLGSLVAQWLGERQRGRDAPLVRVGSSQFTRPWSNASHVAVSVFVMNGTGPLMPCRGAKLG